MPEITLNTIQKGIEDLSKDMATKKEVVSLIDEKIAQDKEEIKAQSEESVKALQTTVDEQKKNIDSLAGQIKLLKSNRFAALKGADGDYNGIWGNHHTAKNFGMFILSEIAGIKAAKDYLDSTGIEVKRILNKDMSEGIDSAGGATVPTEFIPRLIMQLEKYGVFRRNALEYPMGSPEAIAPKLSSGLTVYCPGEGVKPTESDPNFQTVGMNAKKWMTLTAISSELDEDSAIAVGELVGYLIAHAFAKKEDLVGFLGDGTSTYFGHTGISGALKAVDATIGNIKSLVVGSGNIYSELVLGDFESLLGIVPDSADDGDLKFYVHRYFYYTVMVKLALASGGANATEIITGRGVREKTFLSYPVEFTMAQPKAEANSQICALLANLRQGAYLGDRRRITIDQSRERYFDTDQIGIRGTERVAPTVHGVGDTTEAGPICGLITAAS